MIMNSSRIVDPVAARICFLVRGFDGGGAQRDAILLANELQGQGFPSAIVTLQSSGPLRDLIRADVPVIDLGNGRKLRLAFAPAALRRLLVTGRPRALVSSEAAANVLVILASRGFARETRPSIVLREVASPLQARTGDPYWQNRLAYRLIRFAYPRADLVLTLTAGARNDLIDRFGVPAAKVANLGTNAVLTPQMRRRIEQLGRAPEPGLIVSVGRLSPEKGYATLIEAFAQLRRMRAARLTIVGEGDERGNLEALIEALDISRDVSLPGHNPDPLSIVSQASLFVSSSSHEGLGNALIEAMACGVPVVATDAPYGPREILQGGRLGQLVPVGDATALAQAMATTLEQPPESAVLQARAAEFSVEKSAERFIHLLQAAGIAGNAVSAAPEIETTVSI
ncbi:Putative glycosyltranferase [Neorhizobium galegae bv. officinalis]|uniref:Putative glycosyltranferase n=2 Tax=Neorhizobium galegae TaxID=399 RepID=A0A0T7GLS2_NEOGA|nr:Putative glycosyltranferase [Neorhizobium galegae bv. officinalis]